MTPRRPLPVTGILALVLVIAGLHAASGHARAAQATPVAAGTSSSPLADFLRLVPDPWGEGSESPLPLFTYADLGDQLAALGLEPPSSWQDEDGIAGLVAATAGMAPLEIWTMATQEPDRWSELFGFDAIQIDQALQYGTPPSVLTLVRGRFDTARMRAAWTQSGYKDEESVDGAIIASLLPEGGMDLRLDVSRFALGRMNNVAILPDGTIAFAPTLADIHRVIDAAAGRIPSVADQPEVGALLGAVAVPLASAQLIRGNDLRRQPPGPAVTNAGTPTVAFESPGELPPVRLALLGITVGGPLQTRGDAAATPASVAPGEPLARLVFAAVFDDEAAAAAAVPIIENRLATGGSTVLQESYADLFGAGSVTAATGSPVVLIILDAVQGRRGLWSTLYMVGDLAFLAW